MGAPLRVGVRARQLAQVEVDEGLLAAQAGHRADVGDGLDGELGRGEMELFSILSLDIFGIS